MLDFSKVPIKAVREDDYSTVYSGGIQLTHEQSVSKDYEDKPQAKKHLEHVIRMELWNKVYGELLPLLQKAEYYAQKSAMSFQDRENITETFKPIKAIIIGSKPWLDLSEKQSTV